MDNNMPDEIKEILRKKIIEDTVKEVTENFMAHLVFSYWWIAQIIMLLLKVTKVLTCSWLIVMFPTLAFGTTLTLCMGIGILLTVRRISKL